MYYKTTLKRKKLISDYVLSARNTTQQIRSIFYAFGDLT